MTRTVIIDGDIIVYKAAEAVSEIFETETEEDDKFIYRTVSWADKQKAAEFIDNLIVKIKRDTKADNVCLCLSDADANFRKNINPEYKSNRAGKLKPILYQWARNYISNIKGCKFFERPELEADDVIGILATSQVIIKDEKIIWSMDKDFKTIPCKFYKVFPNGKIEKLVISEEEADWWFMYQTLKGDAVDGYTGCKNIGDTKAKKILGKVGENSLMQMWEKVKEAYLTNGMSVKDALKNARMARILRNTDYDFKKKEVKLWNL